MGMLVLTREHGEAIVVGDDITVTVVSILGDKVRLGIDAPREVTVDRSEVRQKRLTPLDNAQQPPNINPNS